MSPEDRHNQLYNKARKLQNPHIYLDGEAWKTPGFFARRKLRRSIALFQQCVELFPNSWAALLFMAKSYQALGEYETALDTMMLAVDIDPENASVLKEIGMTAGQLGRHDLVIKVLAPACQKGSGDDGLYVNLGLSLLMNNQPQDAIPQFQRALKLEPANTMTARLLQVTQAVCDGTLDCPTSEQEIGDCLRQIA